MHTLINLIGIVVIRIYSLLLVLHFVKIL